MSKYIICPECKGNNIKKDGFRKTKNKGEIQRYKCKNCSYRFSIDDGFWKMKNHEDKITSRTIENLTKVLRKSKFAINGNVKIITTDGLQGYPRVLRKIFGLNKIPGKSKIIHNVVIADERGFIHKIERLHNTIRDRTKIMRGFHGSLESAKSIMKGFEIYYNFIRKHQGIVKTPAEEAIPELALSKNKWLSLIKLSKTPKT